MNSFFKALDLYIHDLLSLVPIGFGQKNYTNFIILGRSRVGSTMLRSILNRHSELISFGELFRHQGEVGWDMRYYWDNKENIFKEDEKLLKDPISFLENRIYKSYRQQISAVGFKLFYYHAHQEEWEKVWRYLQSKDIKVIHLKRRDLLRVHASRQLAFETGGWKDKRYGKSVTLTPALCEEDFRNTEQWWKDMSDFFGNNQMLELWYEDLIVDRQQWIKKILVFLNVKDTSSKLKPTTKKQSKKDTADLIENYDELRDHFSDTDWEYLFK